MEEVHYELCRRCHLPFEADTLADGLCFGCDEGEIVWPEEEIKDGIRS